GPMVGSIRVTSGSADPSSVEAAEVRDLGSDRNSSEKTNIMNGSPLEASRVTARGPLTAQSDTSGEGDGTVDDANTAAKIHAIPSHDVIPPSGLGDGAPDDLATPAEATPTNASGVDGSVEPIAELSTESTTAPTVRAQLTSGAAFHGSVYGQPLSVRILKVDGRNVVAEARLSKGATHRILDMSGSFDPDTGRLELYERGGSNAVKGTVSDNSLDGAFYRGKRSQDIALGRQ
ncbi:MAG: hypothetical protein ACI9MC_001388, partial [Kiritimatiellia bacterium]